MAEPSPDSVVVKTIGPLIITMLGGLIGWLPGGSTDITGSALTALLTIAGSVSGLVFAILYRFNSILESGS